MIKSVRNEVDQSNENYSKAGMDRDKWVTMWPG